jgi:hypothetical protein
LLPQEPTRTDATFDAENVGSNICDDVAAIIPSIEICFPLRAEHRERGRIASNLNVRPFEPVDVERSRGQGWTIRHPENVILLRNTLVTDDSETDVVRWVSLIHIGSVSRRQMVLPAELASGQCGRSTPGFTRVR